MFKNYPISYYLIAILLVLLLYSNNEIKLLKNENKNLALINENNAITIKKLEDEIKKQEKINNDLNVFKQKQSEQKNINVKRITNDKNAKNTLDTYFIDVFCGLQSAKKNNICKAVNSKATN
ncbi:hypothetical protein AVCANL279_07385 [Campylobacter canadensis]|uniref:hypothetical protein n=1 Tax=Campylobacter canadensis TaxID=449520 RepID=UPI00155542F6|nr:hypothetical protein [Campylobacter canadensis]MBZ7995162.1 hypothetical protein [Campylobacter canadensis]MBZ7997141.1 hypothetical protein [Campylobacter canadensis]MBZ8000526.1 hypothetical protein [Campylobacter canadensis]